MSIAELPRPSTPAAAIADVRLQVAGVLVDVEGIFAEQIGRDRLVDVRLDRLGAEERLPETD